MRWNTELKAGNLIVCTSTKLKHCDFNSVYTIAEIKQFGYMKKLRVEGAKHFVDLNNFELADIKDVRAMKLKKLNGESIMKEADTGRKIDRNKSLDEKKFKLFEMLLTRWFTDRKRMYSDDNDHWKKYGGGYYTYEEFLEKIVESDRIFDATVEDFDVIKDMTVSEAFDLFIKMKLGKIK